MSRRLRTAALQTLARLGLELRRVPRDSLVAQDIRDDGFDEHFHFNRNSLPQGAEQHLHSFNPRLLELRKSYAQLDWPVCSHSRWRDDAVRGWLNLKYFRGDNIIMWHHREGDGYARLFYLLYLRYVVERAGLSFLDRLREDGAFGCWVYEFPGYPPCSRDLLDSVNELMFLDRHLSLLTRSSVRILDIGAGYGRLAHRSAQSLAGLTDYCCVDAIPESTFLCEYYTGFRSVAPPVRTVPLPEVPALAANSFDLAINVHSFSECTLRAVEWWMSQVARLGVPYLFVVPNEADGFSTTEADGSREDYHPAIRSAGYRLAADVPTIEDRAVRQALGIEDRFCLFERTRT